jgi:Domain of unknown function (DUF4037)
VAPRTGTTAATTEPLAVSGLDLARRFYQQAVRPLLGDQPHAAALLGNGSEVLGYDDAVSTDHDFGPRVQLFLADETAVADAVASLCTVPGQVEITTAEQLFRQRLGVDPLAGMRLVDWLVAPTQILASLTAGAVFHDPHGALEGRRRVLRWYPEDVWRYALAAGWLRVGQEEAFVGRAGATGDDLGSRLVAARLIRELVRLAFLVERRWAPYSKWLGRAFAGLPLAARLSPHLTAAMTATDWRDREAAVCAAASVLGEATNGLGLCEPVDPAARQFYERDIRVVGAERFTVALTEAITDPDVRTVLARLGHRRGTAVGMLPGMIDQAVDSTDVLCHPDRCRAAAAMLGHPWVT